MSKTHWKKLTNPNYLGSYAFQPGEEKTVTIKEVKREIVQNQNGKEECTVAYFVEDIKPLILNKTNADAIARAWGTPYIEDWAGKKIVLKVKKVSPVSLRKTAGRGEEFLRRKDQACTSDLSGGGYSRRRRLCRR